MTNFKQNMLDKNRFGFKKCKSQIRELEPGRNGENYAGIKSSL